MQLSIRLQNHGCRNHPYWWIVVAPNRKNIKGRFIEHVGYFAPREGRTVDRQITLNMPRIKYWMGNGAVPSPKIQTFLNNWGIMPKPFYVHKQLQFKPQEELDEKQKIKQQRKQKFAEREKLHYINYKKHLAKFKSYQTYSFVRHYTKLREKIHAAERENQILRELLLHHQYAKINRINELSGKVELDDTKELLRLEGELKKAKAELGLLERNTKDSSPMQKIQVIHEINALVDKIREVERQSTPFRTRKDELVKGENVTKEQIDRELEYELITKKIEKMNKDMELVQKLQEVVTLEEYANHLMKQTQDITPQEALELAEEMFILRGDKRMPPLTKYELYFEDELAMDPDDILEYDDTVVFQKNVIANKKQEEAEAGEEAEEQEGEGEGEPQAEAENLSAASEQEVQHQKANQRYKEINGLSPEELMAQKLKREKGIDIQLENQILEKVNEKNLIKFMMVRPDVAVPTNRPVHPFPDLKTYVPEEYFEPISDLNLQVVHISSIEPNDELTKYRQKRQYKSGKDLKKKQSRANKTV